MLDSEPRTGPNRGRGPTSIGRKIVGSGPMAVLGAVGGSRSLIMTGETGRRRCGAGRPALMIVTPHPVAIAD